MDNISEPTDGSPRSPSSVGDEKGDQPPRKRQRVRLSCLECRRRKLSCDRGYPCERCLKSGTPDRCTYETRPGLAPPKPSLTQASLSLSLATGLTDPLLRKDPSREPDRVRRLEIEVAQLKNLLLKQVASDGSSTLVGGSPTGARTDAREPPVDTNLSLQYQGEPLEKDELRFFRGKEFRTRYFGPHNASMAFSEVSGSPFVLAARLAVAVSSF